MINFSRRVNRYIKKKNGTSGPESQKKNWTGLKTALNSFKWINMDKSCLFVIFVVGGGQKIFSLNYPLTPLVLELKSILNLG